MSEQLSNGQRSVKRAASDIWETGALLRYKFVPRKQWEAFHRAAALIEQWGDAFFAKIRQKREQIKTLYEGTFPLQLQRTRESLVQELSGDSDESTKGSKPKEPGHGFLLRWEHCVECLASMHSNN